MQSSIGVVLVRHERAQPTTTSRKKIYEHNAAARVTLSWRATIVRAPARARVAASLRHAFRLSGEGGDWTRASTRLGSATATKATCRVTLTRHGGTDGAKVCGTREEPRGDACFASRISVHARWSHDGGRADAFQILGGARTVSNTSLQLCESVLLAHERGAVVKGKRDDGRSTLKHAKDDGSRW